MPTGAAGGFQGAERRNLIRQETGALLYLLRIKLLLNRTYLNKHG